MMNRSTLAIVNAVGLCMLLQPFAIAQELTGQPDLPTGKFVSVLSRAQKAPAGGLGTVSCDYRAEGAGKLVLTGKLSIDASWLSKTDDLGWPWAPLSAITWRLDITDWAAYKESGAPVGSPAWGRVVSSSGEWWLVSTDDASKQGPDRWTDIPNLIVFGGLPPEMRCGYMATNALQYSKSIGHRQGSAKIKGRPCVIYSFALRKYKSECPTDPPEPDTYKVWMDSTLQLPIREEMLSKGKTVEWQTFSDYVQLSPGVHGATHCASSFGGPDITVEADYERFGSSALLPKEFRSIATSRGLGATADLSSVVQKVRFSNWRTTTVTPSFFTVPPGAKEAQ